jgi:prepilin-type N-terminal cleavage/methylation domain-containing protein
MDITMKRPNSAAQQSGFSLVELLVALAIGLVILTAIGAAYLNSTNSLRQREDQAELNDPARIVMRLLRQNLNQAGYVDVFDLDATERTRANGLFQPGNPVLTNAFVRDPGVPGGISTPLSLFFPGLTPVFGCDGAMVGNSQTLLTNGPPMALACGIPNPIRNTLQIAYQGVPFTPANPLNSLVPDNPATGDGRDCLQQAVPVGALPFIINRFSLSPLPIAAGESSELRCQGSGGLQPQPMAAGVEEFVLRYQMAAPGGAANPGAAGGGQAAYINATLVTASAQGWAGVTGVEVCMVSATPVARGAAAPGTAELQPDRPTCLRGADGQFQLDIARAVGDTRLWKRFTTVVSLRNAVIATPL